MDEKTIGAISEEKEIKGVSYKQGMSVPYRPLEGIEKEDCTPTITNFIDKAVAYLEKTAIPREWVREFDFNARTEGYIYNGIQVLDENKISFPRELGEVTKGLVLDLIQMYGEETFKEALKKFIQNTRVRERILYRIWRR